MNPEPATQSRPTHLHRLCAVIGLVAFAIPAVSLALLLLAMAVLVATIVVAGLLAREGVLDVARFDVVLRIGVFSATGLAVAAALARPGAAIRRRFLPDRPRAASLAGWSWSLATGAIAIAFVLVVPTAVRSGPDAHSILAGAIAVASALWAVGLAGAVLARLLRAALRLGWLASTRSAFAAGACFAGGLGVLAFSIPVARSLPKQPSPAFAGADECDGGAEECFRRVLVAESEARHGSTNGPTLTSFLISQPDDSDAWARCIDDLYRNTELMHEALRLAASVVEESDASDIVHDTLLTVCAKSPENLRSYLLKAISNGARTHRDHPLRRPGRSCPIEDAPVQACLHTPELELSNREAVNRAMCVLAPEDRALITMISEGWTAEQIAEKLGINAAVVRKRKQRASAKFRQEYKRLCK